MSNQNAKSRRVCNRSEADWILRRTANGQRLLPGVAAHIRAGRHMYPTRSRPSDCSEAEKVRSIYLR
jgi:hypothetical protein